MAITVLPDETNSELIIDPDAVLSFSVSLQSFKTVSGRYQQVRQLGGVVEHSQLPPGKNLQLPGVSPHLETVPYAACILRSKGTNHVQMLSLDDSIVKQFCPNGYCSSRAVW